MLSATHSADAVRLRRPALRRVTAAAAIARLNSSDKTIQNTFDSNLGPEQFVIFFRAKDSARLVTIV